VDKKSGLAIQSRLREVPVGLEAAFFMKMEMFSRTTLRRFSFAVTILFSLWPPLFLCAQVPPGALVVNTGAHAAR
jgi:hypothetical protein